MEPYRLHPECETGLLRKRLKSAGSFPIPVSPELACSGGTPLVSIDEKIPGEYIPMRTMHLYTLSFILAAAATVQGASVQNAPSSSVAPPPGKKIMIKAFPAGPCAIGHTTCEFRAAVTDAANTPLSGVPVELFLKGVRAASAATQADGSVKFRRVLSPGELPVGSASYEIRAAAAQGLPTALLSGPPPSGSGTVTVVKGDCALFLDPSQKPLPPDAVRPNSLHVDGQLNTLGAMMLPGNRNVKVAFAGRSFNVVARDGRFTLDIPLSLNDLTAYKTSPLTGSYAGDGEMLACDRTKSVNLQAVLPQAWGYSVYGDPNPPQVRLGDTARIKVHFHTQDPSPKPVAGMPFAVVAADYKNTLHLGSGVSDGQGNASISYRHATPFPTGSYTLQIRYNNNGQEYVNKANAVPGDVRDSLTVLQTETDVEITSPRTAAPGEPVTVKVKVTRRTDHAPVSIKLALSRDDGAVYPILQTTDSQGVALFTFNMSPKKSGAARCDYTLQDATSGEFFKRFQKKFSIAYPDRSAAGAGGGTLPVFQ